MYPLRVFCVWMVLALSVETKEKVPRPEGRKYIIESVRTNCDHDFVEYFREARNMKNLYTFRVVKTAPSFTISIVMRAVKSQRIMYQVKELDGCQFLKNQWMSKMFAKAYQTLLVNNSFFTCPIYPKVYYLKNLSAPVIAPGIHPLGYYQMRVRIAMAQSPAPFVMEVLWKYTISL